MSQLGDAGSPALNTYTKSVLPARMHYVRRPPLSRPAQTESDSNLVAVTFNIVVFLLDSPRAHAPHGASVWHHALQPELQNSFSRALRRPSMAGIARAAFSRAGCVKLSFSWRALGAAGAARQRRSVGEFGQPLESRESPTCARGASPSRNMHRLELSDPELLPLVPMHACKHARFVQQRRQRPAPTTPLPPPPPPPRVAARSASPTSSSPRPSPSCWTRWRRSWRAARRSATWQRSSPPAVRRHAAASWGGSHPTPSSRSSRRRRSAPQSAATCARRRGGGTT